MKLSILYEISKLEVIETGQSIEPTSIWYEAKRVTQKGNLGGGCWEDAGFHTVITSWGMSDRFFQRTSGGA